VRFGVAAVVDSAGFVVIGAVVSVPVGVVVEQLPL